MDVVKTLKDFNTFIPTGNAKIGEYDYQINADGMVQHVEQMNQFPIRVDDGGATVYIRDVGRVEDTHQIQSNIVRVNGRRQVYIPIYRQPGANTIAVVDGIKETIGSILSRLPRGVNLDVVLDQSVYVRKAIAALEREALYGALLAAVMIWLFIGSLRSTAVIMLSVPLSVLAAITCLYATGDSLNAMTLGGLALAVGRLVDDSIVVLENTHRHVALGKTPLEAARIAADEVRVPILVATVVTIVVFAPVVFLTGIGRFLFTPLAMSVAFAMAASYIVALTIVPAYCARFLRSSSDGQARQAGWALFSDRAMRRLSDFYGRGLGWMLRHRFVTLGAVALVVLLSIPIYPLIGTELFPRLDTGQFRIQMRAPSGTRIERTEQVVAAVEAAIREEIAPEDLQILISNTGVLYDWPAAYTRNAGPMDSSLMVQLHEDHGTPSFEYVRRLRQRLRERFPMIEFSFETGGIISSAINFGLPAPINIQVNGDRLEVAQEMAREIKVLVETVPGGHRRSDPAEARLSTTLARDRSLQGGSAGDQCRRGGKEHRGQPQFERELRSRVLDRRAEWKPLLRRSAVSRAGHRLDRCAARYSDYRRGSGPHRIGDGSIVPSGSRGDAVERTAGSASQHCRNPAHQRADGGHPPQYQPRHGYLCRCGRPGHRGCRAGHRRQARRREWPEGYRVDVRGEVASMRESFGGLAFGFGMAVILVYFVMVALFRSFLDPFIVMLAVPLGLLGVVWILWLTDTTLNIQSFMGAIFMIGIAASTSTLLVEFANRLRAEGRSVSEAALEAARIRMRPILMTTGTALLALLPPALNPAEPIMPLARAVIGGLASSTVFTLVATPLLYREFKRWTAATPH